MEQVWRVVAGSDPKATTKQFLPLILQVGLMIVDECI
jgi:hypothetical protein